MTDILSSPALQQAIANIVLTVVGLLATVITGAILSFIKSKVGETNARVITDVATVAVTAAEQAHLAGFVTDKKASALNAATELLKAHGITISAVALDAAIEAAVMDTFNSTWSKSVTKTAAPPATAPAPEATVAPTTTGGAG